MKDEEKLPNNYKYIRHYMIYDVKIDLTRKVHLAADGHKLLNPTFNKFASVLSHDRMIITLIYVAFNDVEIMTVDLRNAFFQESWE